MSAYTPRNRRLPISCEACRTRKIRCPRDGSPCSTCIRRGLTAGDCHYAKHPRPGAVSHQPAQRQDAQSVPISPLSNPPATSESTESGTSTDQHLAERVRRLEQLLQDQDRAASISNNRRPANHVYNSSSGRPFYSSVPGTYTGTSHAARKSGSLRVTASGHVRYMPPQSPGWDSNSNLPDDTSSFDVRSSPLGSSADLQMLLASLPPTGVCTELVRIFFSSFASLFHILHDPTFFGRYELFLQDAESVRLEWLALLYTILATAVTALSPDHPILAELSRKRTVPEKIAELSERWRSMALKCLEADQYFWRHSLTTLQCLTLIIYSIGHTHGQTWTLLGLACHLAQSIGCHVDPEGFDIGKIEKEERRRCWAALMMLYTNQNTTIGMIGPSRAWTLPGPAPPADVDDEDIEVTRTPQEGLRSRASQMTYLLLKFRLYDICAEISESVLKRPEQPSMHTVRALDAAICDEQASWSTRYSVDDDPQPCHAAHLNVLYSYSDHLALLLHRGIMQDDQSGDTLQRWSQQRRLETAKRLIRTHASLDEDEGLAPFRWYNRGLGSFHAFHAAVVLFSLTQMNDITEQAREDYHLFQSCLLRLQSLSDSSPMCSKAAAILQCLSSSNSSRTESAEDVWTNARRTGDSQGCHAGAEQRVRVAPSSVMSTPAYVPDWTTILGPYEPQQWLSPTCFPWDEWNFAMNSELSTTCG